MLNCSLFEHFASLLLRSECKGQQQNPSHHCYHTASYKYRMVCFVYKAEIDCGWPKNFWNGYVLGEKTTLGSTLFFR